MRNNEEKISIVITSFKEPLTIGQAIEAIINQKIDSDYELVVSAPDKETQDVVKKYEKKHPNIRLFKDPGIGKTYALNLLFRQLKGDIWIFTDGDVYLGNNSVNEILKLFKDENIGCVTGRPVSTNSRNNMLGYWSHLLADVGAHRVRKELFSQGRFLECSGYLFAFRNNGIIKEIPRDVAEDSIIPYLFWKEGYKVGYADKAKVFVKNPTNFSDWLKQRKRTAAGHEALLKYAPDFPRVKSFKNEASKGMKWIWRYPKDIKEFFWTFCLVFARFYMWISLFYQLNFLNKSYKDGWERVESTK